MLCFFGSFDENRVHIYTFLSNNARLVDNLNESPVHIFSFYLKAHVVGVDLCENRVHICVHQLK